MLRVVSRLVSASLIVAPLAAGADDAPHPAAGWRQPPPELMEVLHAPQLPWVWTSPSGTHLLLANPVTYPPLAELAAPKHALAGIRVDPVVGAIHGRHGATSPRLVAVEGGAETGSSCPRARKSTTWPGPRTGAAAPSRSGTPTTWDCGWAPSPATSARSTP
jgi:hypothetical protein